MANPLAIGSPEPRRAYSRQTVGIAAHFETLGGRQSVRLIDLSQGGAHLILSQPVPLREGVLFWLRFDIFADVVWQEGEHVGLKFDELVPIPALVETRLRAPSVVREAAQAWVSGD